MKNKISFLFIAVLLAGLLTAGYIYKINVYDIKDTAIKIRRPSSYSSEIEPYINYLKSCPETDPVDYVVNLFDKYDIVVIGERWHPEITQYDLIYKIISDKRFIEKCGNVFTELGTQTINDRLDVFLKTPKLKGEKIDEELMPIYRDLYRYERWEKYNLYDFYKKIYYLNSGLPDNMKISVKGTDTPIDWNNISSHEEFAEKILATEQFRDKTMANYIRDEYKKISDSSPRKKVLVIMNTIHSFKAFDGTTTEYLAKEFPGKTANVMLNTVAALTGSSNNMDKTNIDTPLQRGKWDAAFRYLNINSIAFDFEDTPFGKDRFDYAGNYYNMFGNIYSGLNATKNTYQDVYTGYVFYYPLEKHKLVWGIPGFLDHEFFPIFNKRCKIINPDFASLEESEQTYANFNNKFEQFYDSIEKYNTIIEQWLVF